MGRIIIAIIIVFLGGTAFYLLKGSGLLQNQSNSPISISTFEQCVQSKEGKVNTTFPGQCESPDGKTYIEKVNEPVDISNWTVFNDISGFSFKCPPSWECQKTEEDAATVYQKHYLNISAFHFKKITSQNFQESALRHPSYKTPLAWFKDLEAKKELAIKVLPSTIQAGKPGTGEKVPPRYSYFKFEQMLEAETKNGKALIFPGKESNPDTSIIIPLNNTDIVLITLSPASLYQDPIIKAIISSVRP